jgi:hypothetical protein
MAPNPKETRAMFRSRYTALIAGLLALLMAGGLVAQPPARDSRIESSRAHLEAEWAREDTDSEWSLKATEELHAAVARTSEELGSEPGHSVQAQAECRKTFCKLQLSSGDPDALSNFTAQFPTNLSWNATIEAFRDSEFSAVIFLSREGHKLPKTQE